MAVYRSRSLASIIIGNYSGFGLIVRHDPGVGRPVWVDRGRKKRLAAFVAVAASDFQGPGVETGFVWQSRSPAKKIMFSPLALECRYDWWLAVEQRLIFGLGLSESHSISIRPLCGPSLIPMFRS